MVTLIVKCLLRLLPALCLLVAGMRYFAYDARYFDEVRTALIFSQRCGVCYYDIRPGDTTMDDALRWLHEHPAQFSVVNTLRGNGGALQIADTSLISIQFHQQESGYILDGSIVSAYSVRIVSWIRLTTAFTLGDVWLALGQPPEVAVYDTFQVARYDNFSAQTPIACGRFWEMPVEIIITDRYTPPPELAPHEMRRAACQWSPRN